MADERNPLKLNELSNLLRRKRAESQLWVAAGDEIERIQSLGRAGDEAQARYNTVKDSIAAAKIELAEVNAAAERAKAAAAAEGAAILAAANSQAEQIKEKARKDVAEELSSTNDALAAAKAELAAITAKSERIHAAING
jgi:hypothetical protein